MEQILLGACQHLDFRPWNWGRRHHCCFQPLPFWYSLRPPSGVLQGVTLKTRTVCQTRLVVVSTGNLSGRDSQVYSRELMLREAATALQARSGWAHTAPQTRGPITAEVSLSPLEAGTSKIKAPGRLGVRRGLPPGSRTPSSCGTRGEAGLRGLYKALLS